MPGPVSDSYDPEFGTGANADEVRKAVALVRARISPWIDDGKPEQLRYIVEVAQEANAKLGVRMRGMTFTDAELRVIRFCLDRAMESV